MQFQWDDELLAAGHRAGLEAIGRGGEPTELTARFRHELLPALLEPGASARLDYALARTLLGAVGDDEVDRFLDAEHAAWRPARSLVDSAHALLESLRGHGLRLAVVATRGPSRRVSSASNSPSSALCPASTRSSFRAKWEHEARRRDLRAGARRAVGVEAAGALFVGDRLVDDIQGAAAVGMTTVQALWFRADEGPAEAEPDALAVHADDVQNVAYRLGSLAFCGAKPSLARRPRAADNQSNAARADRTRAPPPPTGRDGAPPVRSPLRQGRLSGRVPVARLPLRLLVRGVGEHVRRLHAEGVRRRDRPRDASRGRAPQAGSADPRRTSPAADVPGRSRADVCVALRTPGRTATRVLGARRIRLLDLGPAHRQRVPYGADRTEPRLPALGRAKHLEVDSRRCTPSACSRRTCSPTPRTSRRRGSRRDRHAPG